MVHALEERLDHRVLGGRGVLDPGVEHRRVAQALALGEVVAEHGRDEDVVAPPLLGLCQRRADGGARVAGEEVGERKMDAPRRDVVEVGEDLAENLVAVVAPGKRRERRARQHPSWPDGVLFDRIDRNLGSGEELDRLDEFRVILEGARMGSGARLLLDDELQSTKLARERLGREAGGGGAFPRS